MADVHTKAQRSYNMSQIKGKNTKPEMIVRKFLHAKGFRYQLHNKKLPGRPDLVLPRYKTAIFINGCFWHGHAGCKYYVIPKTNTLRWTNKIERNKSNDEVAACWLKLMGWKVLTVWECDLKKKPEKVLSAIFQKLR